MTAQLIDGNALSRQLRLDVAQRCAQLRQRGVTPGLAVILVGDNPASEVYVRNKLKSAGETGMFAELIRLPATATLPELLAVVDRLNRSDAHDGILVQSPLPALR